MAPNSSNLALAPKVFERTGEKLVDEKIDERILNILGLEDIFDIDYDTYLTLLKEVMVRGRMPNTSIPTEEIEMLTEEYKRVKSRKGRFKVKKITAESFKRGTAVGINLKKQKILSGVRPLALPAAIGKKEETNNLQDIVGLLDNIIKNLTLQNKEQQKAAERERKESEKAKRGLVESKLEKGFAAAIRVAEKVLAPVKSLLSRIIDFFMAIFWGKVFLKLIDWFADPANKKKVDSLFRFFKNQWPTLLALYLRFGTGLGKSIGILQKVVFFGTRKLLQIVAQLVGAKAAARFLGGKGGKLAFAALNVGATVGTTMALSKGIEDFSGLGGEQPTQKYYGGGLVNLFKNKFKGFFGGGYSGRVSGPKGVDKVPAMLSDGEFVMSRGAVQKYGVGTLEAMNASGGGTNKPKIMGGTTYAAGGGLIGYASDMIKHHEALSSLKQGQNYYVSVKSPEYKKVNNNTKIYPYLDSMNVPTIGWGATYYDKITQGSKPVRITDPPITKKAADSLLNKHLGELIPRAKSRLPLWNRMSQQQQGTIVSFLYNAGPNAINPSGPYPRFSKALMEGNMKEASANVNRSGPPQSRINEEKRLLTSGPLDLKKAVAAKPKPETKTPGIFDRISSGFGSLFASPARARESRYADGGMVNSPVKPISVSKTPVKAPKISPPSKVPVMVTANREVKAQKPSSPGRSGTPQVPAFSSFRADETRRRSLQIYGIG